MDMISIGNYKEEVVRLENEAALKIKGIKFKTFIESLCA